jgi:hypothetical protein
MASAAHRLHLLEYGAETDTATYPVQETGSILDDAGVLRLLLGEPDSAQLDRETAAEGDALAPVKGVMLGLLLTIPLWSLLAALLLI